MTPEESKQKLKQLRACVLIPNYNHGTTVARIATAAAAYCDKVIVIDDGSTDTSAEELQKIATQPGLQLEFLTPNRGKGKALQQGFRLARQAGFRYAITMDADGQHFPEDLPLFADRLARHDGALLVGSRCLNAPNMPSGNTFANRFSNFWFAVQTGRRLPDTQTGFRAYPLWKMGKFPLLSSRYEAELEWLVRAAWRSIPLRPIPIKVYYPPQGERISHFRPGMDFLRISLLNTVLCIAALFFGYPSLLLHHFTRKRSEK